jgi:hypothetical protein
MTKMRQANETYVKADALETNIHKACRADTVKYNWRGLQKNGVKHYIF